MWAARCRGPAQSYYALTVTITNSGLNRVLCMDLIASSAVSRPMTSASLRLEVILIGLRSMLCTYAGARVPPRFTFTRNLIFVIFPLSEVRACYHREVLLPGP